MSPLPTILLLSGSQRSASLNTALLRELAARLEGRCHLDWLRPEQVDLPLFDQDLEHEPRWVRRVRDLSRRFAACHALLVAVPEYNGQPTPYLKNLIDWVSRLAHLDPGLDSPFAERPLQLCSASTGWSGGALGLVHARALFAHLGCAVLGPTLCVPHADRVWSDEGPGFDPAFDEQLELTGERLLRAAGEFAARARQVATTTPFEAQPWPTC